MADLRKLVFNLDFVGSTSGINNMNSAADKLKSKFSGVSGQANGASAAIYDAESKTSAFGGTVKTLGTAIAGAFAVSKIIDFGKAAVSAAGEAQAMNSQFTQTFGELEPAAQSAVDGLSSDFGMVPNRIKPAMSQMTAMFKGLGLDTASAMGKASDAVTITADAAAFYDKSFEDANSALTSFIKGNYEGGESIGLFANDTQMANYAVQQGLVTSTASWSSLDEATKQATRLEYAQNMQTLAGATGQAAREQDGLENQLGNIKQAWQDFLAIVGGPVLGVAIQGLKGVTDILQGAGDGFKSLTEKAQSLDLSGIKAEFAPFGEAFSGIKDSAMNAFDGIKSTFTDTMPKIIESGKPIFDAFVGMWESVKPVFLYLADTVSGVIIPAFQAMYSKYIELLPSIIAFVSPIYEVIAGIGSIIGNVIGVVTAILQGDWASAWNFAGGIVSGIGDVLNGVFGFIANIVNAVWQGIVDKATETWSNVTSVWNAAVGFFSGIISGIQGIFASVSGFIIDAFDGAVEFVSGLPDKFLQWGKDMIDGLIQGVKDKIAGAVEAVKEVATGISDAFTDFFDINSPSRLMRRYGQYLPQGLAIGIEDEAGKVDRAFSAMAIVPDFMKGLASGISGNAHLVKNAVSGLSTSMGISLDPSNSPISTSASTDSSQGAVIFETTINVSVGAGADSDSIVSNMADAWEERMTQYVNGVMLRNPQLTV